MKVSVVVTTVLSVSLDDIEWNDSCTIAQVRRAAEDAAPARISRAIIGEKISYAKPTATEIRITEEPE